MSTLFTSTTKQFTMPNTQAWVRVLGGNALRGLLIIYMQSGNQIYFNAKDTGIGGAAIAQGPFTPFKWKDWGPLMTGEIYVRSDGNPTVISVTEVLAIPQQQQVQ